MAVKTYLEIHRVQGYGSTLKISELSPWVWCLKKSTNPTLVLGDIALCNNWPNIDTDVSDELRGGDQPLMLRVLINTQAEPRLGLKCSCAISFLEYLK